MFASFNVGTSFNVVTENEEQVEISFTRKWDSSPKLFSIFFFKFYLLESKTDPEGL